MRILVTGSNGMVGHAVREVFKGHDLILTDKHNLDVTDADKVLSYWTKEPELIMHLAAETDLEYCQRNPSKAYMTNTTGTMNVVMLAKNLNIPIIYMSTAGIYDGSKQSPYDYRSQSNAINAYGRSKLYGEYMVSEYRKHFIFRASWMMGGGPGVDKKFVNKFITKVNKGEKVIKVCDDVFGSPTYTIDLVKSIKKVIGEISYSSWDCENTFNLAGLGVASRFDVAQEIVKILGLNVKVVPVKSTDVGLEFPCPRAKNEVLVNNGPNEMRHWKESLKEYLLAYYRH